MARRAALRSIGVLGGVAGLGTVSAREEPFTVQARSVTNAAAKYRDVTAAVENGFQIMRPYVPDMGFHLVHPGSIHQAARAGINIRHPQGLTYNLRGELGSVEYTSPLDGSSPDV